MEKTNRVRGHRVKSNHTLADALREVAQVLRFVVPRLEDEQGRDGFGQLPPLEVGNGHFEDRVIGGVGGELQELTQALEVCHIDRGAGLETVAAGA